MKIKAWYSLNFESRLAGRYITLEHISPLLKEHKNIFDISTIGLSELGNKIPLVKIGIGKNKVLAWSQMHGNESTTTKAIFDFLKFLAQKEAFQDEISVFFKKYTLYILPLLNPDGASCYTRENSNAIDLNRDAKNLSQKESKLLFSVFEKVDPQLCLNLHDQRSLFGLQHKAPATVSFLSPSADEKRSLTSSRKKAMEHIVRMNQILQDIIPNQVGRYDDSFNVACVGDSFQKKGVPTILFEAGHFGTDYLREKSRSYIFYSFLELFGITRKTNATINYRDYFLIPENKKNYRDFILRNILINGSNKPTSIAIQYSEKLVDSTILFDPLVDCIGDLENLQGHIDIDAKGEMVLMNSQKNIKVGEFISTIINKNKKTLIYFDKNHVYF